jgi:hypothetical protein
MRGVTLDQHQITKTRIRVNFPRRELALIGLIELGRWANMEGSPRTAGTISCQGNEVATQLALTSNGLEMAELKGTRENSNRFGRALTFSRRESVRTRWYC